MARIKSKNAKKPSHVSKSKVAAKATTKSKVLVMPSHRADIPITQRELIAGEWFAKLVALQKRLLAPGGCPWDREQTHQSLRKYLIEETYETLDAMESGEPRKFAEELGDLLLQVVFHSVLAEHEGTFTISDVVESIHSKMVRRHPHVFGDVDATDSAAVLKNWEQIKAQERAAEKAVAAASGGAPAQPEPSPDSILGGVPRSLPAVLESYQLARRASRVGFDWLNLQELLEKLDEEMVELRETVPSTIPANGPKPKASPRMEEEAGDLLFTAVNVARFLGVDPEIALKKANKKFKQRFQWMESAAEREGSRFADLPRAQMEALWDASKVSK